MNFNFTTAGTEQRLARTHCCEMKSALPILDHHGLTLAGFGFKGGELTQERPNIRFHEIPLSDKLDSVKRPHFAKGWGAGNVLAISTVRFSRIAWWMEAVTRRQAPRAHPRSDAAGWSGSLTKVRGHPPSSQAKQQRPIDFM